MINLKKISYIITIALLFSSCGGINKSKVHHKQRTSSDIKISSLDLQNNEIQMRFEYRTYVSKTLESISCQTAFTNIKELSLKLAPHTDFESFATEILTFSNVNSKQLSLLVGSKTIPYTLSCEVNYDKGNEFISADSILHLVPGTKNQYR